MLAIENIFHIFSEVDDLPKLPRMEKVVQGATVFALTALTASLLTITTSSWCSVVGAGQESKRWSKQVVSDLAKEITEKYEDNGEAPRKWQRQH